MIDLHTHLLPAVDDGVRTARTAFAVLGRFAADGVTTVVCTPHLRASDVRRGAVPTLADAFDAFVGACRVQLPAGPELLRGWEIMLDDPGVPLHDVGLRLGESDAVLVELPNAEIPPALERELERLRGSGIVPIMAHPERYAGVTVAQAQRWRAAGAVLQGDATTLCGSGVRGTIARALLADGAYDVLASDNHGDVRTLAIAREYLSARGAADVAALLTTDNPSALLRGTPCTAVPGTRIEEGVAASVRGWFAARLQASRRPVS